MKIEIKDSDDLNRLLDALADEIVNAHTCHRLYCNLVDAIPQFQDDMNQSPVFWHYTLSSLRDTRFLRLCRIYEQHSESLNLHNLLETIQENLHLFDTDEFKKRLKDNAFVESLASHPRRPDPNDLARDLAYVSEANPIVKKLIVWRNNIVAHRGAKLSLGRRDILDKHPISKSELEKLLDRSLKMFNYYSSLFRASTWSRLIGEEDYMRCLKMIRKGIRATREEHRKEMAKLQRKKN
jgi:hypothetical protein